MWCDTAQCLALPPQKWVRAGLCPEARGHGFSSGMSPSKATRATILPPLPVAQGAPACSALLKKGTKPPPRHPSSFLYMPQAWLGLLQSGCPRRCPGWQWSPACRWPAAACAHGGQKQPGCQHSNTTSARLPTCRSLEGTSVSPAQCMVSTGGMWCSWPLVPRDTSFSCTNHREARIARTSPGATHICHSPQRSRHPSLPRVSTERAEPPQHRDSLAGATLLLSVMETLVPVPCSQLPPALPCRQSGGSTCPGQAPASQPGGRRPAGMKKVFRKHDPTPAAPRRRFAPRSRTWLHRPAPCSRHQQQPRHDLQEGSHLPGPPGAGGPTLRDRQGRVSGSGRAAPSSPEAPGRSGARSPGHREDG